MEFRVNCPEDAVALPTIHNGTRDGASRDDAAFVAGNGHEPHAEALVLPDVDVQVPLGQGKHAEILSDPSFGLYV